MIFQGLLLLNENLIMSHSDFHPSVACFTKNKVTHTSIVYKQENGTMKKKRICHVFNDMSLGFFPMCHQCTMYFQIHLKCIE